MRRSARRSHLRTSLRAGPAGNGGGAALAFPPGHARRRTGAGGGEPGDRIQHPLRGAENTEGTDGLTAADEARDADHGRAVEQGRLLGPGDPGSLSREGSAGVHHGADDGVSTRRETRRPPGQEDRECPHLRGGGITRGGAPAADRRAPELLWRTQSAADGPPDRGRQAHARRSEGGRTDAAKTPEEGETLMTADVLPLLRLLADHVWQSTLFAGAVALLTLAFRRHRADVRFALWLVASVKFLVPLCGKHPADLRVLSPVAAALCHRRHGRRSQAKD